MAAYGPVGAQYEHELVDLGLLADATVRKLRWFPVLIGVGFLVTLAVAKIEVALATGHSNVAFLIIATLVATILLLALVFRRQTRRGRAVLGELNALFRALRRRSKELSAAAVPETTMLAAVFGVYVLPEIDRNAWRKLFPQPLASNSSGLWMRFQRMRRWLRMWRRRLRRLWRVTTGDQIGLGWRAPLAASIFTHLDCIDVIEVVADDYFEAPGRALRAMRSLGREVPMMLHGVALGLASTVPVARKRVERLARIVNALEPTQWSEHLAFVRGGSYEIGHLAAPPRNPATVAGAVENVARIRSIVGVAPALENIATLVDPPDSSLSEPDWVGNIATASASPLLLDLHNLYANAVNFGHDPHEYLRKFPLDQVRIVHISGGHWIRLSAPEYGIASQRLLDDHVHDVPDVVFSMLVELGRLCPQPLAVILERDGCYPEFPLLLHQLRRAREALAQGRRGVPEERQAYELAAV